MRRPWARWEILIVCAVAACGGSSDDGPAIDNSLARGSLFANPPNLVPVPQPDGTVAKTLAPGVFAQMLDASQPGTTQVIGVPRCAITTYYMKYGTVGGAGESTDATGAIMVPSGADPSCSGARPVVLYAHGTTIDKSFNMANLRDNQEAALVAAAYAAQGYIVVAPNYAGYDTSALPYHPYLNAQQSSSDMIDALRAARKAFPVIGASPSGALLLAGYSEGGHVAMATQRAMQLDYGAEFKVTGLASMSGPHAMALLGDTIFGGAPNLGGTVFIPLIATSWQRSYGNVYTSPGDLYEAQYAAGIEALLPSSAPDLVLTQGKLPPLALFAADSAPRAEIIPGTFDAGNLIRTSYRNLYLADLVRNPCNVRPADPLACAPAFPVRQDLIRNDLRTYVPSVPTLLCGGHDDPTIYFASTLATAAYFRAQGMSPQSLEVLDVDSPASGAADPFAAVKAGFSQAKRRVSFAAAAAGADPAQAVTVAYHESLLRPFCTVAARAYFQGLQAL